MLYRQSIALFGFVLPAVICAIIIGAASMFASKLETSFEGKKSDYRTSEMNRLAAVKLEAEIKAKREFFNQWESLLSVDAGSAVQSNIRLIQEHLPSEEFQLTSLDTPTGKAGLAVAAGQDSAQVRLGFRASYRSMQRALLEIETRMPQLQLDELRMEPSSNSNSLDFNVNYTAWKQ